MEASCPKTFSSTHFPPCSIDPASVGLIIYCTIKIPPSACSSAPVSRLSLYNIAWLGLWRHTTWKIWLPQTVHDTHWSLAVRIDQGVCLVNRSGRFPKSYLSPSGSLNQCYGMTVQPRAISKQACSWTEKLPLWLVLNTTGGTSYPPNATRPMLC